MSRANGKVSDRDLERTLERGAKRGSVEAAKLLMRLRRKSERAEAPKVEQSSEFPNLAYPPDHPLRWTTLEDPFLVLEADAMAMLTAEQREYVLAKARVAWAELQARREARGRRDRGATAA